MDVSACLGIDGEGLGSPHRYVLLAAASADGSFARHAWKDTGLSTIDCLEFILALPAHRPLFAYSFGYDITKILADCPDNLIYHLMRPELRQRPEGQEHKGPIPCRWNGYRLNLVGTRLMVGKTVSAKGYFPDGSPRTSVKRRTIWDIWKFFQGKFVTALEKWNIPVDIETMRRMKDSRATLEQHSPEEIRGYCYSECRAMAQLAIRLTDAHTRAGLTLKDYFGAGSSASAMLAPMGISKYENPPEIDDAVMRAFFGGRFEHSVIGPVKGPIYGYDISSAYPYQLSALPCLIHGTWQRTTAERDILSAASALVRFRLADASGALPWGPFPYRELDGSITYPANAVGWVWRDEYLAGKRLLPKRVRFCEAWTLRTTCDCRPFATVPGFYEYRTTIGKDAAGIVIKLALNSIYGKLAQSVGKPRFQCWIWAGMVTSGCRAMILDLIKLHRNRANVLAIATDGLYTRERICSPLPRDTGTNHLDKPLGGWEEKVYPKGMFFARPGIYWPLEPSESELDQLRARGLGRAVLVQNYAAIAQAWAAGEEGVEVTQLRRFCGAKSSISRTNAAPYRYTRSEHYGQWVNRPIELSFDPMPKRAYTRPDNTLALRLIDSRRLSAPYRKGVVSPESADMLESALEISEQPDLDLEF